MPHCSSQTIYFEKQKARQLPQAEFWTAASKSRTAHSTENLFFGSYYRVRLLPEVRRRGNPKTGPGKRGVCRAERLEVWRSSVRWSCCRSPFAFRHFQGQKQLLRQKQPDSCHSAARSRTKAKRGQKRGGLPALPRGRGLTAGSPTDPPPYGTSSPSFPPSSRFASSPLSGGAAQGSAAPGRPSFPS